MAKLYLVLLTALLAAQVSFAQSAFKVVVKDDATKEPLAGVTVTVKDIGISATTDTQGVAQLPSVPAGEQIITIFSPGYESKELKLVFPRTDQNETVIFIRVTNGYRGVLHEQPVSDQSFQDEAVLGVGNLWREGVR